ARALPRSQARRARWRQRGRAQRGRRQRRRIQRALAAGGAHDRRAASRPRGANEMTEPARILVVDDEAHLADGIRENLEAEGYRTSVAHDGRAGLELVRNEHFDLLVVDVMMPRMDGLELCATLRREGMQTPVLFLTVKGEAEDRVRGFEAGGDDYLTKPFHLRELLLRVAAILRRTSWYKTAGADTLSFGGNRVDFKT